MSVAILSSVLGSMSVSLFFIFFRHEKRLSIQRTQEGQAVVEAPLSVVEALVCYGQPLDLVAQHLVPVRTQHAYVGIVQSARILIHYKDGSPGLRPYPKGGGHTRGSLLPSWAVGRFAVVFVLGGA
jgi:hypothetical protein